MLLTCFRLLYSGCFIISLESIYRDSHTTQQRHRILLYDIVRRKKIYSQNNARLFCPVCPDPNFEFAEPYCGVANSIYVLFLDVNMTTNSWKVWKYKVKMVKIEYQTEENRVMTTETGFLELKI